MGKFDETAKKLSGEIHPALIATASKDSKSYVSAKGSFRVLVDDHVAFNDMNSPRMIANLEKSPQVSIIGLDSNRSNCRIWGTAEVLDSNRSNCRIWGTAEVLDSDLLYDEVVAAMAIPSSRQCNRVKCNKAQNCAARYSDTCLDIL